MSVSESDATQEEEEAYESLIDAQCNINFAESFFRSGDFATFALRCEDAIEDLNHSMRQLEDYDEADPSEIPMEQIRRDDVEEYVNAELIDIAFGIASVVLIFEKDNGDLIGLKAQSKADLKTCSVEEAE